MAIVDQALAKQGLTAKALERWKEEMPREEEMRPKDKYTFFDRKEKNYRKGVHSEFRFLRSSFFLVFRREVGWFGVGLKGVLVEGWELGFDLGVGVH